MSAPTITVSGGFDNRRKLVFDNIRAACSTYDVRCNLGPDGDGPLPVVRIVGGDAAERNSIYDRVKGALIGITGVSIFREDSLPVMDVDIDAPQPETDGDLMTRLGMDAQKWAVEFGRRFDMATVRLAPEIPSAGWVDKADLIVWFANAIMAGYDRGREQGEKEERERVKTASWTSLQNMLKHGDWQVRAPTHEQFREELAMAPKGAKRVQSPFKKGTASYEAWMHGRSAVVKKIATLLIPRIDNDGHDLAAEHAALQVELIGLFGGYTATAATGGWRDGLTIYRDELTRYDVAVKAFDTTVERDLQRVAERMARACHQECIMLVLPDGQAICVDAAGGVR